MSRPHREGVAALLILPALVSEGRNRRRLLLALPLALVAALGCAGADARQLDRADWPVTGGTPANERYSPLTQINTDNVARLRVAWVYHSGDAKPDDHTEIQATPIVVDGVLYATTPTLAVVALRADSGTRLWRFDPFAGRDSGRAVFPGLTPRDRDCRPFGAIKRCIPRAWVEQTATYL